uniref:Uncharacterized protein n=1 Tax=Strigamia maritima TaxID=126957 RepID=T1JHG6_STRMM
MASKRGSSRSSYRYNQTRKKTAGARCKTCCRRFTAFMFSHVGLCALVVGYAMIGALVFQKLEENHNTDTASAMLAKRESTIQKLWDITNDLNILYKANWTKRVSQEMVDFQKQKLDDSRSLSSRNLMIVVFDLEVYLADFDDFDNFEGLFYDFDYCFGGYLADFGVYSADFGVYSADFGVHLADFVHTHSMLSLPRFRLPSPFSSLVLEAEMAVPSPPCAV